MGHCAEHRVQGAGHLRQGCVRACVRECVSERVSE